MNNWKWKIHIFDTEANKKIFSTDWMPTEEIGTTLSILNKPSMFGRPRFKILLEPFLK